MLHFHSFLCTLVSNFAFLLAVMSLNESILTRYLYIRRIIGRCRHSPSQHMACEYCIEKHKSETRPLGIDAPTLCLHITILRKTSALFRSSLHNWFLQCEEMQWNFNLLENVSKIVISLYFNPVILLQQIWKKTHFLAAMKRELSAWDVQNHFWKCSGYQIVHVWAFHSFVSHKPEWFGLFLFYLIWNISVALCCLSSLSFSPQPKC